MVARATEAPEEPDVLGGSRVKGRAGRQQARADLGLQRPPAQAAATAPVVAAGTVLSAVPASDPAEALQKIGKLRDDGVITEDDFQAKKSELLARM